jgi:formate dehydrogenase accessory protein FdhD
MAVADHPLAALGYAHPTRSSPLVRLDERGARDEEATVAEEVPVALVYNGRPHVVVMATPADLEDLAVGFTCTEGIVASVEEIERVDIVRASHGVELQIEIPARRADLLADRTRALVSRTGCGLCGVESIAEALRLPADVGHTLAVDAEALWRAGASLGERQPVNAETNTVHAAAWATADGTLHAVREDVGRHNALDKLLGVLAREGTPARDGFVVVTSRASYEMVQKAAACGVELLAAISRPTGLAIRVADAAGVTLVGLLRGRSGNVYCRPERIHFGSHHSP